MNKFLLAIVLALCTATLPTHTLAATRQSQLNDQFLLNKASPNALQKTLLGTKVIFGRVHEIRAYWDFADQGGAVSTITLKSAENKQPVVLPKGAIVTDCLFDVVTAPSPVPTPSASPTPTLAFGTGQAANDLKAATASGSYTGVVACVPVGTAATAIKLTADRTMTMAIGTAAVAAGKIYVLVQYVLSDTL